MQFELQPKLEGEVIRLRPLERTDFEDLYLAASDPLIWEVHPEPTRYQRDVFQQYFDSGIESGGAFVVINKRSERIIGGSRYFNYHPGEKSEIEIGYSFLERAYWGGAYNRELKRLMIEHAIKFVERVVFIAGINNFRSRRALEKIGTRFAGELERPNTAGVIEKNALYEISREMWEDGVAKLLRSQPAV